MNVNKKLKEVLSKIASGEIHIDEITEKTVLTDDLGFDSVQMIMLIVEIESQFGIEIEDDDLDIEKLIVYKSLYDMVCEKLQENCQ